MGVLENVIDFVLPPRCIVTGEEVDAQGMVTAAAWRDLQFIAPPYCARCGLPFDFAAASVHGVDGIDLCRVCLERKPSYASARAALIYDDLSREIILRFKHGDQTHAIQSFLPWLKVAGQEILSRADVLVPVPLHRWRLLRRRYNQAAVIAQALARQTGKSYIPDLLCRQRPTLSQGHMRAKERVKNVRNAFVINSKRRAGIQGKAVLLIDDVYTTGATVNECARALLKAGAGCVNVLTLARVVRASDVTG